MGRMEERVFTWSHGRRVRILVTDTPGDFDGLVRQVEDDARRIVDRDQLADEVSAVFRRHVRLRSLLERDGEELVLHVG